MVASQLVEQLLLTPKDPGLNPTIRNFMRNICLLLTVEKT